ncbi:MAG: DUF4845 domain-containing protein [Gammaproteobacteria bacterium]
MVRTIYSQRGLSAIGLLASIAGLAAVVTLLLRLGPHSIDWQAMKSIFNGLPAALVHTMSKEDIRESLKKRFKVNSLRDFDLRDILTIDRQKTGTTLSVQYEKREHIVGNVDVVLSFSGQYEYH